MSDKPKVLLVLYKGHEHAKEQKRLLGCLENELGARKFIEDHGYQLVSTDDKDPEPNSTFDKELETAEVVITTPFFPGYLTRERIEKAKNLKICITAGVGSDHVDLTAANEHKITVAEVTGSNVVSVAEHVLMSILLLVRNYPAGHQQVIDGEWDIAGAAKDTYDLEDKVVATVGAGRIGYRVLERLIPFNPKKLLYYDYQSLPQQATDKLNQASKLYNDNDDIVEKVDSLEEMVSRADVVTINCPLHEKSKGLFNKDLISHMKDGAWLVNTARGAITVDTDIAAALESGKLSGYAGDVWPQQPAPKNHVWRSMKNPSGFGNGLTVHVSGTSIDAQARYSNGVIKILKSYFDKTYDYNPSDVIVINGDYATKAYGQREKK